MDQEKSKLTGDRRKRKYVRKIYFRDQEYDLDKKVADEFIRMGWMKPATGGAKAEVKTKAAEEPEKKTTAKTK